MFWHHLLLLALCYLIGSIPIGYLVGLINNVDITKAGSGNIGFTNVWRVCGFWWGLPVLFLDLAKGLLVVLLIAPLLTDVVHYQLASVLCGLATILGNIFPFWLKFKGGKGVATTAGVMIALAPVILIIVLAVWLIIVLLTKLVSLASLVSAFVLLPIRLILIADPFNSQEWPISVFLLLLALMIFMTHRSNIKRLLKHQEEPVKLSCNHLIKTR